jgi:glycolate dehydrogenase FAD-linked subunit
MPSIITKKLRKRLRSLFGERFDDSQQTLICYSYDAGRLSVLPDAVVWPANTAEVSQLLELADNHRIPILARGAGSGMVGGTVPVSGGIVISFERMNRILRIDTENMITVVQPGVITEQLQTAVEKQRLFYPPDPASRKFCTLGGNVATGAGGLRAVKYGVTRDYVLALEAVLPDGSIIKTGSPTLKGVVGYDLTRLLIGSEGTLAVVTEITLKLRPLPESQVTILAILPDTARGVQASNAILASGATPAALELIDKSALRALKLTGKLPKSLTDAVCVLLIEDYGTNSEIEEHQGIYTNLLQTIGATQIEVATDQQQAQELWAARRSLSAALYQLKPNKLNEDVTVPRSELERLISGATRIADEAGLTCAIFGHAGDGNVHVNVLFDADDQDEAKRAHRAVQKIMELTVALNGTISGEHGVGLAKKPFISLEIQQREMQLMREIKKVFDPHGILNPGKIFPDVEDNE